MKMDDIMKLIESLAMSKGFYTRLYNSLLDLQENDPDTFEELSNEWESMNFTDDVDFILYLEA